MKVIVAALALFVLATNVVSAELPTDTNMNDAWSQKKAVGAVTRKSTRISYSYTHEDRDSPDPFYSCRIDYTFDGNINLFATEAWYHVRNYPISSVATHYWLKKRSMGESFGSTLVRRSYQFLSGPDLIVEPALPPEDLFTKYCVPLLEGLFKVIPEPESALWKDQYGKIFGVQ